MESLDHAVGLRVVGRRGVKVCAQEVGHRRPEFRHELRSTVRCHVAGNAETSHPVGHVSLGHRASLDVSDGYGLRPTGKTVDNCH